MTPHLQGYFTLKRSKRLPAIKKLLGDAFHFEPAIGNKDDNFNYVFKDGSAECIKYDNGGVGKRNDITDFLDKWRETGKRSAVIWDPHTYVKFHKGLEKAWAIMHEPEERTDYPNVVWLYGPTGIGKTHYAASKGSYWIMNNYPWFDGYENQDWVILDEIDKWEKPISGQTLLQLLDKYNISVQVKGSCVRWNPPNILITSTQKPDYIFQGIMDQLSRRITLLGTKNKREEEWEFTTAQDP